MRRPPARRPVVTSGVVLLAVAVLVTACGSTADPAPVDVTSLSEAHPCGHGFALGTPEQDVALVIHLRSEDFEADRAGEFARTVQLPEPHWTAEVQFGERLFEGWCNDISPPPELAPVVVETWAVTGGQLIVQEGTPPQCDGGSFTGRLEDLEVTPPDGEPVAVGDLQLVNDRWGCFGG